MPMTHGWPIGSVTTCDGCAELREIAVVDGDAYLCAGCVPTESDDEPQCPFCGQKGRHVSEGDDE